MWGTKAPEVGQGENDVDVFATDSVLWYGTPADMLNGAFDFPEPRTIVTRRWRTVAVALTVSVAFGCRAKPGAPATTAPVSPPSAAASPPPASPAPPAPGSLRVWLGTVVSLDGPRSIRVLSDPPDQEVSDVENDVAVLLQEDARLQGFRMSTGELLWERTTTVPCRKLLLTRSKVHTGCGNQVFSLETTTGKEQMVDKGPYAGDPVLASGGAMVAVPGKQGRVALYSAATGGLQASKVLPELSRAFQTDILANPASPGICVLGLVAGPKNGVTYRAGCYNDSLTPQWSKAFPFAADHPIGIRQLGPEHLVLDDQESALDPSAAGMGRGRGLLVRWRDGQATPFTDNTFATLENAGGERLRIDSDVFELTRTMAPADPMNLPLRFARVVADGEHVFALIVNGTTALAGIDRAIGHVWFLVRVAVGPVWTLGLEGGLPVVRSRYTDRWEVTVYDPVTGGVRYHDSRPRVHARP